MVDSTDMLGMASKSHRVGRWENLQETLALPSLGLSCRFSHHFWEGQIVCALPMAAGVKKSQHRLCNHGELCQGTKPTKPLAAHHQVISATVLYSFEHDPSLNLAKTERTFEDALIYMVNIFAGRDPPWYPGNPQAKIASVIATTSGIIFIPFLVGRSAELFMGGAAAGAVGRFGTGVRQAPSPAETGQGAGCGALDLWVAVLAELDDLETKNLLPAEDLRRLRRLVLVVSA